MTASTSAQHRHHVRGNKSGNHSNVVANFHQPFAFLSNIVLLPVPYSRNQTAPPKGLKNNGPGSDKKQFFSYTAYVRREDVCGSNAKPDHIDNSSEPNNNRIRGLGDERRQKVNISY